MTLEEAKKMAAIAMTADGGCVGCVTDMFNRLQKTFPEFTWKYTPSDFDPYVEEHFEVTERAA